MTDYKPFRCRYCRSHLALTNGERLILGEGAYSDEAIPIRCVSCGLRQVWKPLKKPIDTLAVIVYTDSDEVLHGV